MSAVPTVVPHQVLSVATAKQEGIVAAAAVHRIVPHSTTEGIVTVSPGQHVGGAVPKYKVIQRIPSPIDGGCAGQGEALHVRGQGIRDRTLNRIDPVVGQFDDEVTGVVDDIRVIAIESGQDIRVRSAIEHVCGYIARDSIGEIVPCAIDRIGPGQDEELNVGTERRGHVAEYRVDPGIGCFDNRIACADDIRIVPCASSEYVGSAVAREPDYRAHYRCR